MAAPKGNKFAIGNSGKPKMFNSPEELEKEIEDYFKWCDDNPIREQNWVGKEGSEVYKTKQRPYLIEGLCLRLNCERQTLLNYEKKPGYEEYFDILTRAKRKITQNNLTYGLTGEYNPRLVQFLLTNNAEYKDKSETDITSGGDKLSFAIKMIKPNAKD